jgi:hypothetical protein
VYKYLSVRRMDKKRHMGLSCMGCMKNIVLRELMEVEIAWKSEQIREFFCVSNKS